MKKASKFRYLYIVFFLISYSYSYSQRYALNNDPITEIEYLTSEQLLVFEDISGELSFNEISAEGFKSNFVPRKEESHYSDDAIVWLKFTVENNSNRRRDFVLFSNDWDVQFYSKSAETNFYKERQGVLLKSLNNTFYSGENIDSKISDFLHPKTAKTYYVKTPGVLNKLLFKRYDFIYIIDREAFDNNSLKNLWAISVYLGLLILISLGNFYLLIISFKWRNLFYGLTCLCYMLFFLDYYKIPSLFSYELTISNSIYLPLSSCFYLLFIFNYLSLERHSKWISFVFKTYIILASMVFFVLLYLNITDMVSYFRLLPIVNFTNSSCIILSTILIIKTPGKLKYFIFAGISFLVMGFLFSVYSEYSEKKVQTFLYSIIGNAIEMVVFLFGIIYLNNQEKIAAKAKLLIATKELEFKRKDIRRFSNSIRDKNKLIESFEKQIQKSGGSLEQNHENLNQLIQSIILTDDDWEGFKKLYGEVHPNFFFNLKDTYPNLTNAEVKLITLMKLQLSNKEIANMLGIGPKSVIKTKYRLKKKLLIDEKSDLEALVESF